MSTRAVLVVACLALVLAPGCELISIPLKILDALTGVLFFWAKAPGPAPAAAPLPLNEALARALESGAAGTAILAPAGTPPPLAAGAPPFPGAVPVSIPVVEEPLSVRVEAALRRRGLALRRAEAP